MKREVESDDDAGPALPTKKIRGLHSLCVPHPRHSSEERGLMPLTEMTSRRNFWSSSRRAKCTSGATCTSTQSRTSSTLHLDDTAGCCNAKRLRHHRQQRRPRQVLEKEAPGHRIRPPLLLSRGSPPPLLSFPHLGAGAICSVSLSADNLWFCTASAVDNSVKFFDVINFGQKAPPPPHSCRRRHAQPPQARVHTLRRGVDHPPAVGAAPRRHVPPPPPLNPVNRSLKRLFSPPHPPSADANTPAVNIFDARGKAEPLRTLTVGSSPIAFLKVPLPFLI
jgi:hypothetical protein